MSHHFFVGAISIFVLACASNRAVSDLPYCPEAEDGPPPPEHSCRDDGELAAFREAIERLVVPRAGPLLVRIDLGEHAGISGACAVRGYGSGQWSAKVRLAEVLMPPPASLSAPACAANSRLEFNRAEATYEAIRVLERDCARQSRFPRDFVVCLDYHQKQREEIWIFASRQRYRVFVPSPEPSSRRITLLACTQQRPASGMGTIPPVGIAQVGIDLEHCMTEKGWNELK